MALSSFNCWGGSRTPSALKVVDTICSDLGSAGTRELTIIASAGCCGLHPGDCNTSCLRLGPTNHPWLVRPGQTNSGGAKRLDMPAQQIASEQALVENPPEQTADIRHIHLQSGSQLKGHAGCTYYLDRSSVGTRDILGHLFLNGQPVGVCPLLGQQSNGRSGVDHQEALRGLALGLVTPRGLTKEQC